MRRKIYEKLLKWKNESAGKTCLLVEGARRIGKSYIVEEFAKREYSSYILIDFYKADEDVKSLFMNNLNDLDSFFMFLSAIYNKKLYKNESLIIFDEVQFCPQARAAIKYLVADGRYHFIETGSLLSIKENTENIMIPSEERHLKMYPMDFEEFLWARNNLIAMDMIKDAYLNHKMLDDGIHRKMMQLFREYMTIGGMPQAVEAFNSGATFNQVDKIKQNIIKLYEEDLNKNNDNGKATKIYKSVPNQLGKNKKRFNMTCISKNSRFREYQESIDFVEQSMIVNECNNVSDPGILLELSKVEEKFKLYMGDTGLLITCIANSNETLNEDIYKLLLRDKVSDNLGMIYENVVAQILRSMGYKLYFHEFYDKKINKKDNGEDTIISKKYEIDFIIVKNKKLCPIEVKSGLSNKHTSFDMFKNKYQLKIQDKYVIHCNNYKEEDGITYLPIYMLPCINDISK